VEKCDYCFIDWFVVSHKKYFSFDQPFYQLLILLLLHENMNKKQAENSTVHT